MHHSFDPGEHFILNALPGFTAADRISIHQGAHSHENAFEFLCVVWKTVALRHTIRLLPEDVEFMKEKQV